LNPPVYIKQTVSGRIQSAPTATNKENNIMKILVLNCGSSSIKYKLFDMSTKEVLAQGGIEKIGLVGSFLKLTLPNGEKKILEKDIPEHTAGIEFIMNTLISPEYGAIKSLDEINAVGHRMVHGGERFSESVKLDKEVLDAFTACNDLAPLHNPANLKGVNAVSAILPNVPQVGVFDTAFHQTMPDYAYLYAIPYELYEKYGVRRYGFHGTSHRYVSQRVCDFLGVDPKGKKIITCHIGNGGSISAIKDGKCIDTSMGLTPLEGLVMGTRSGDIDAGAVTFIMEKEGLTPTGVSNLLNKKSGVLGVSGVSSDMRELEAAVAAGNPKAILAEKMYFYRIKKYIGSYAAALGGVDIILFTGGVGENQANCRSEVCEGLEFMGVKIDLEKNKVRGEEAIISADDSKVTVAVIPTDEELMIASDTMAILNK
jgi:acetate kinase